MKNQLLATFALILSLSANAVTPKFCPISKDGKVRPSHGYKTVEIKPGKDKDVYTLAPSDNNPYGGNTQVWVAFKDKQGRVIRVESGGERPSEKLIAFEQEKRGVEKEYSNKVSNQIDSGFKVAAKESIKQIFASPQEDPILFGKAVEMYYEGDNCYVGKVKERLYDPKSKRNLEKDLFSIDRCQSIDQLYSEVKKDINECAIKSASHNSKLAEILNNHGGQITYVTSGAGGGGGSPIRSIASIIESEGQMNIGSATDLSGMSNVVTSKLQKERDLCRVFGPEKANQSSPSTGLGSSGHAVKEE